MGAGAIEFTDRGGITGRVSHNGTVTLAWEKDPAVAVEVQHANHENFSDPRTRYAGTDRGSVVTGLDEGAHWFRVRAKGTEDWSEPLQVTVEFFPLQSLFLLLGIGGVVVVATLSMIIIGHFNTKGAGRYG